MFRRKEEGLFDSATEENQAETINEPTEATLSSASNHSTVSSSNAGSSSSSAPSAAQARPVHSAVPTASSFRPNAPLPSAGAAASSAVRGVAAEAGKIVGAASNAVSSIAASLEKAKAGKRVLTVGNDILLKGEIATCDRLVIEGQVDATLNDVHTVEIAECGSFKGSAQIEDAEISGLFEGNLVVRGRLVIYATGKVRGTISYGEIEIERGGELTGEIKIAGSATRSSKSANAEQGDKVAA